MKKIIVTRHTGLVTWLKNQGIEGEVISHVESLDHIKGKKVYGVLPLHLAAEAAEVWSVDMPRLPAEKRGVDISPEEMDEYGATLTGYTVRRI